MNISCALTTIIGARIVALRKRGNGVASKILLVAPIFLKLIVKAVTQRDEFVFTNNQLEI